MAEDFKELITQVSNSENTTEDVKHDTIQILNDAQGIIDLAKGQGKEKEEEIRQKYEAVRIGIIEATKNDLEITKGELSSLKEKVSKTNNDLADFYVENQEMFKLETNKDIVIKTLKKIIDSKETDENIKKVDFKDINPRLLQDIEVIKATRAEGIPIFGDDIIKIPNEFFTKESNIEQLLKITSETDKVALIIKASKCISNEKLINLIGKINKENNGKNIIEDKDIPLNLLNSDTKNIMGLKAEYKAKYLKKVDEITVDAMDNILKNDVEGADLAYEIEYYLQKYDINNLSDTTLMTLLSKLDKSNSLIYAPKLLLSIGSKINIINDFSNKENPAFIQYLPVELTKNNVIQKNFINIIASNGNVNTSELLGYLEIDDIEIAKYFYTTINNLGEDKSNTIFSNINLREKIRRIIGNNKESSDPIINEMVKRFSSFDEGGKNLINAVKENQSKIDELKSDVNSQKIISENIKKELSLSESSENINKLITKITNLKDYQYGEPVSISIYNDILKVCGNEAKATEFIKKVKEFNIAENKKETDLIKKEIANKDPDGNINTENIEKDFDDLLIENIENFKEENNTEAYDFNDISKKTIDEYIAGKDDLNPEQKTQIKQILILFIQNKKISSDLSILKNSDNYKKVLLGEITKEEYNKISNTNLEKNYDFEAEKTIVEKQQKIEHNYKLEHGLSTKDTNFFTPTEDNYTEVDGGYNLIGIDGEPIKGLIISEEEKKMTLGNPEATENLINFFDFFKELNLESVWTYRKELLTSIGDLNINDLDDDNLSKSELIRFGNSLITAINKLMDSKNKSENENKPKLAQTNSISGVRNELRKFSLAGSELSNNITFNIQGEDRFATLLRNFGIIGGAYFKTYELRKLI